jgi:hypothetical protein
MPVPQAPPLNGRAIAEFYTASEVSKLTTLRAYAKPPDEPQPRIIMYDPVRKILREYFGSGRDGTVLDRVAAQLSARGFKTREFTDKWYKSNSSALRALRDLDLGGEMHDVRSPRAAVTVGALRVISSVDFYATFVPRLGKTRRVGVVINPSGIRKASAEVRRTWISIESEVAWRAAQAAGIEIDEIMYIDLPKSDVQRYKGPKVRIWDEVGATCKRIVRDWREIRLEQDRPEHGTG